MAQVAGWIGHGNRPVNNRSGNARQRYEYDTEMMRQAHGERTKSARTLHGPPEAAKRDAKSLLYPKAAAFRGGPL